MRRINEPFRRICFNIVRAATAVLPACGLSAFIAVLPGTAARAWCNDSAEWIWVESSEAPPETVFFRKEIDVFGDLTSALLRSADQYAEMTIYVDGIRIGADEAFAPLRQRDVTANLPKGRHVLAVQAKASGPLAVPAIFLKLDLEFNDGSRQTVVSDESWKASREWSADWNANTFSANSWVDAHGLGDVGRKILIPVERQANISAVENYEQWKQALSKGEGTDPAAFILTPGFKIDRIRSAAPDEDSWVSLAFDPAGRVIIAMEKKGLLRMTLDDDGDTVVHVDRINDTLEECRGLVFAFDELFVNANNSLALYRLRRDGEGEFAMTDELYASTGGVGHGRNDLALGADGYVYAIHGDSVDLPANCNDFTSPLREARRGIQTREGHLLRVHPKTGCVDIIAAGLRNPFGIDFNPDGELFTYDADAEYDMGAPWYRPTRVNHLVMGGDYGWRGVTREWPPYYHDHPDNAVPNLDIGKGSPTAVKFGTRSHFPSLYRDALFVLDWAYGRILAVHTTPRGSSYLLTAETFLKGRPLNVTDLDFAPDGSMYFVTGGRETQSALYRIRYVGDARNSSEMATPQQTIWREAARQSRALRRELEARLAGPFDENSLSRTWPHLSNSDPWIRYAARNVLERHPLALWMRSALDETQRPTAVTALLALARTQDACVCRKVLQRLNDFDWSRANTTDREKAVYAYWLGLKAAGDVVAPTQRAEISAKLSSLYPDPVYAVNRWLSELTVELRTDESVGTTMLLAESSENQRHQMHFLHVLRNTRTGWTEPQRASYIGLLDQSQHYFGGAGMPDFRHRIREEALATLTPQERQTFSKILEPASVEPTDSGDRQRPFVQAWSVQSILDSMAQLESPQDLKLGEDMFVTAMCVNCHRVGTKGTFVGPDLTHVSSRFGRRDLLESIINPSRVIPDKYRALRVVTHDGRTVVGQVASGGDYRSPVLRLATHPLSPHQVTEIPKTEIAEQSPATTSWMPSGLLDTLQAEEILALLLYLEAGGRTGLP